MDEENPTLCGDAYRFAEKKHAGQKDDSGRDYFDEHVYHVAVLLESAIGIAHPKHDVLIAASYLHDTLEDTDTTIEELTKLFGKEVAGLVVEVTKVNGSFPNLHSEEAVILKFCDRLSNLSRMGCWPASRREHYINKSNFWKNYVGRS